MIFRHFFQKYDKLIKFLYYKYSMMIQEMTQGNAIRDPDQWDISALQMQFKASNIDFAEPEYTQNTGKSNLQSLSELSSNQARRLTRVNKNKKRPTNSFANNLFSKNKLGLKKVLKEQKVKQIINTFRQKIKRNIPSSNPVEYQPFQREQTQGFFSLEGFVIPQNIDILLAAFSIFLIIGLCFIYTLSLVFQQILVSQKIEDFQIFIIVFYATEIIVNFLTVKTIDGKKLITLKQIASNYAKSKFKMDIAFLIILIMDISLHIQETKYFRLFVLFKIKESLNKMEKIQNALLTNFYKQQYWSLAKVFLVNFAFAHCLAVLLIAMSWLSKEYNWLQKMEIANDQWFQIYAWSYYWGTTTMLTVGFGDLTPANYKQAICLTIIQTFSCILLAYNINCVGTLISNIRSQDIEKNKNLKIMRRLAKENNITEELQWRVCNYINESDKMRKKFQFETDKEFISKLPQQLKGDFLKQSNIKLFKNLPFFSSLTQKTLLALAQQIEVKIAHPEQIIFKGGDPHQFLILRGGKVGYCTKIPQGDFNSTVIDIVKLKKQDTPKFLHLNFFINDVDPKYTIKSVQYSILAILNFEKVLDYLRGSNCDFENFCQIRDKSKHVLDEFQTLKCQFCNTKHSKMKCPKIHFIPISQQVIFRHLQSVKKGRCDRKKMRRLPKDKVWIHLKKYSDQFRTFEQMVLGRKSNPNYEKRGSGSSRKSQKCRIKICDLEKNESNQLINQIGFVERAESFCGIQHFLKNKLTDKIVTSVTEKVSHLLSQKQPQNKIFFSWKVQTDELNNFNYYFSKFNPQNLSSVSFSKCKDSQVEKQKKSNVKEMVKKIFSFNNNKNKMQQHNE